MLLMANKDNLAGHFPKTFHDRAEARGIYSNLKEVDLLATLPLEVAFNYFLVMIKRVQDQNQDW